MLVLNRKSKFLLVALLYLSVNSALSANEGILELTYYGYHNQPFLSRIKTEKIWELFNKDTLKSDQKIKVLVCDTGIESSHPAIANAIKLPGINSFDGSTQTEPSENGHGTRMAGLINVVANNQLPLVEIIPGKISNLKNGFVNHDSSAKCIRWGADHGARIVNLSYSGAADNAAVIEAAQYLHEHNGLLIMSAGDFLGETKNIPDNPNMIVVGYVSSANFVLSRRGPYVDLVAPGTSIISPSIGGTYISNRHGASEAAAITSGAAALILAYKPEMTDVELRNMLLTSTNDMLDAGRDNFSGNGFLNLEKAASTLVNTPKIEVKE